MASDYTSWASEPNTRGTWSILSSCIITLVLCVYTAVHLSVPAVSETRVQRWRHTTKWVLLGILAPEFVVWTAWCQRTEAKELTEFMQCKKKRLKDTEHSLGESGHYLFDIAPLIQSWTLRHSYFVAMGGIQLRPSDAIQFPDTRVRWYHKILPYEHLPQGILSLRGFRALLEDGHGRKIPAFTEKDIDDKSKADRLAKVLSCLQGSWLLVQIVGRWASRLTITELEINTLAHVICAFALYGFWFYKPLRIEQPIFLDTKGIESWTFMHFELPWRYRRWIMHRPSRPLCLDYSPVHVHSQEQNHETCQECLPRLGLGLLLRYDVWMTADQVVERLNKISGAPMCDFVAPAGQNDSYQGDFYRLIRKKSIPARFLYVNQAELDFVLETLAESPQIWNLNTYTGRGMFFEKQPAMIAKDYVNNATSLIVAVLLSSFYGAIHASLWRHHFPTEIEMRMWRASCLIVAGSGMMFAFAMICWLYFDYVDGQGCRRAGNINSVIIRIWTVVSDSIHTLFRVDMERLFRFGLVFGLFVIFCAAVFCRLFLFVEAFVSLRSQPWSVYQTPDWIQWLPHL